LSSTRACRKLACACFSLRSLQSSEVKASRVCGRPDVRRRPPPWEKGALSDVLTRPPGRVLLSEHLAYDGRTLFAKFGELGCEGIVSKRIDAP
jgi:hypothetical protein